MRIGVLFITMWILLVSPQNLLADLYIWVDADGVKHVSNNPPPDKADVIDQMTETPYDAVADLKRRDREYREQLERRAIRGGKRQSQSSDSTAGGAAQIGGGEQTVPDDHRLETDGGDQNGKSWAKRQRIRKAREALNKK